MSFTDEVVMELLEAEQGRTCCRKALLFGLFFGASTEKNNIINADFRSQEIANAAAEILKKQFSSAPEVLAVKRAGRTMWRVRATTKALSAFLQNTDREDDGQSLSGLVGFRCDACARSFLRGVFVSSGSINDPKKGYHLELSINGARRAERVKRFLSDELIEPKTVQRASKIGLYYKKNMQIADILYYLGAMQSGFDFSNVCIERDIRNIENRATNCVARNISRAVEASLRQAEAIELLERSGKMPKLGEELRYTARLRLENPSMSLTELALLHDPPISKSGLNRRLVKILEEAELLRTGKEKAEN